MLVKSADSKQKDLDTLEGLLAHPQATADQRRLIEQELRTMRSGIKGETEAAYDLDFHYGASANWALIHDLRIEHAGQVAQIDHLAINRLLEVWVCESKRFSEGVSINEHGEFTAFHAGKPRGMPSPIEQNRKHCMVLGNLFSSGKVALPKRLGLTIRPNIQSVVLVSKNARIGRPKKAIAGLEQIIKVDQFCAHMGKQTENTSPLALAKVVASETLTDLAYSLAALHVPIQFNWAGKFGLGDRVGAAPAPVAPSVPTACQAQDCGKKVSAAVVKFCHDQHRRFGGKVYCMDCQKRAV